MRNETIKSPPFVDTTFCAACCLYISFILTLFCAPKGQPIMRIKFKRIKMLLLTNTLVLNSINLLNNKEVANWLHTAYFKIIPGI